MAGEGQGLLGGPSVNSRRSEMTSINVARSVPKMKQPRDLPGLHTPDANDIFEWNWEAAPHGETTYLDAHDLAVPVDAETGKADAPAAPVDPTVALEQHGHIMLGQFRATAVAGNDITSSIFYTIGVCVGYAGKWAPISITLVVFMLYLFRAIYTEVCTALPLNGGTYNVLLNVTTKPVAALAAALSMLSYLATAVVSAFSAAQYLGSLVYGDGPNATVPHEFLMGVTTAILGFFALLNLLGLSESATTALIIFTFHLSTMAALIVAALVYAIRNKFEILVTTWQTTSWESEVADFNVAGAIYFGFSAALLGVSGFESSANYIEEQKEGVYAKTLRNMWVAVMFINPACAFLSFCVITVPQMLINQGGAVLSSVAFLSAGQWLKVIVVVDAFIVLSGAVLTAYVGVIGLVTRMAMDRCLPDVLITRNKLRNSAHWIIIGFFGLTTSLLFICRGDMDSLAGVYTMAFLSVMSLFAIGNIFMKYKRSKLPRTQRASWLVVLTGLFVIIAGLIGNIILQPAILAYFFAYFGAVIFVIFIMFARVRLLRIVVMFTRGTRCGAYLGQWAANYGAKVRQRPFIFFTKDDNLEVINKAITYVTENELTSNLKVIHLYPNEEALPRDIVSTVHILDRAYPKLKIDVLLIRGEFGPETVNNISKRLNIPKNYMFIACPGVNYNIADFNGLRIITH